MKMVLSAIKTEHAEIKAILTKVSTSRRVTWADVDELYVTLRGHQLAEEKTVFAKAKHLGEQAKKLIEALTAEHDQSENGIKMLIAAHKLDRKVFAQIEDALRTHFEKEEVYLFQVASQALTEQQLMDARDEYLRIREETRRAAEAQLNA